MATSIQWTDETWNPTVGCDRISPGCAHCYAKSLHDMRHKAVLAGAAMAPQYSQPFEVLQTIEGRLDAPLHWRKPRRVFVNSVSDLFHEDVPDEFIGRVFEVMACAKRHTFQILTKRAERMRDFMRRYSASGGPLGPIAVNFPHVWLGVSVENQHFADERIPLLLQTPAAVRFISAEPLLDSVNLARYLCRSRRLHVSADVEGMLRNRSFAGLTGDGGRPLSRREAEAELWALHAKGVKLIKSAECAGFSDQTGCPGHPEPRLEWVIVGGESGAGARPFNVGWARSIMRQCKDAGVAVFVKQLGKNVLDRNDAGFDGCTPTSWPEAIEQRDAIEDNPHGYREEWQGADVRVRLRDSHGGDMAEWPEDLRVREFPTAQRHGEAA